MYCLNFEVEYGKEDDDKAKTPSAMARGFMETDLLASCEPLSWRRVKMRFGTGALVSGAGGMRHYSAHREFLDIPGSGGSCCLGKYPVGADVASNCF